MLVLPEVDRVRWQGAADLAGLELGRFVRDAVEEKLTTIERDRAADLELDQYVRAEVDAAIAARSADRSGSRK